MTNLVEKLISFFKPSNACRVEREACSLKRVDCSMKREKGIALLMMLIMISSLAIVVMICAFVLSHEVNKDERYDITRQRMLKVKRALIGRLADVSDGEDITSCGGFISDYGEPDSTDPFGTGNFLKVLLDRNSVTWLGLPYDYVNEFWAGYRGERYLNPPSGETDFKDGWGNSMQVSFDVDKIKIRSLGKDGMPDGAIPPTNYDKDIEETFYWHRETKVKVKNIPNTTGGNVTLKVDFIYPNKGKVKNKDDSDSIPPGGKLESVFDFGNLKFPVGLRKIVIYDVYDNSIVKITRTLCISPGTSEYGPVEIDYSG